MSVSAEVATNPRGESSAMYARTAPSSLRISRNPARVSPTPAVLPVAVMAGPRPSTELSRMSSAGTESAVGPSRGRTFRDLRNVKAAFCACSRGTGSAKRAEHTSRHKAIDVTIRLRRTCLGMKEFMAEPPILTVVRQVLLLASDLSLSLEYPPAKFTYNWYCNAKGLILQGFSANSGNKCFVTYGLLNCHCQACPASHGNPCPRKPSGDNNQF